LRVTPTLGQAIVKEHTAQSAAKNPPVKDAHVKLAGFFKKVAAVGTANKLDGFFKKAGAARAPPPERPPK